MNFYVTILGSGAAIPTLGRHCSAQVVNMNGFRMLLDCGESTQNQLRAYHQKMQSLGHIFISHLHGDHLFGLPGLLSTMHLCGRTEPVTIYAPKGLRPVLELLFEVSGTHLDYELVFVDLEGGGGEILRNDKCVVKAFPIHHSMPCYGFLFEENIPYLNLRKEAREQYGLTPIDIVRIKRGEDYVAVDGTVIPNEELTLPKRKALRYAYCCDTSYNEDLVPYVRGVDLLCLESTFDKTRADLAEQKQHCTAEQAGLLARQAGVGRLLLTHFSARYSDSRVLVEEAQTQFGNVTAADDGMCVEVR